MPQRNSLILRLGAPRIRDKAQHEETSLPCHCRSVGTGFPVERRRQHRCHFGLPVGSILIKTFALQGRLIETRVLIHTTGSAWTRYSYRMHNRSGYAMPKIGSNLVDVDGVAVVDQWISELVDCSTGR